ncbi:alpha-1,4-glucan:alpha-1,4-glucan 6-glycosyltransferase [Desulfosporosinus orientis DSM 765]|uniref:1,4-alpha-glucan branching enzyme GlgB n=1 Tax=Desulfosporosinus orientis (strain ATCC 19365 / DSM 765 / NCIMB 8382 / VKM B-1628 / Singapore I) TaxID=768706 RepID=G7WB91_DESOD|nr:alpha-1,4-glucan:alpha-1,4-glucan 6-glycosyltransferase [Desulfosporosinus orientis DSM 765]
MSKYHWLTLEEVYLFNRGELYHSYLRMGAHRIGGHGIQGTHFAVWVPDALKVFLVGEWNHWRSDRDFMLEEIGSSGIWTLFVPENLEGQLYKYEIHTKKGQVFLKADPFAFCSELRPATASRVWTLAGFSWQDQEWLERRKTTDIRKAPLLIYEVHPGSWRKRADGSYYQWPDLGRELISYVVQMGYTHIELMPIMEHPFDGSWGYQATGYYACTSRFGSPQGFMAFVNQCHRAGIGVILDWVPGHFCKDAHGLGRFNGDFLYERDENQQWGTYNFNFEKTEVWSFLISNAVFWLEEFHVDGLRVDGVSNMLYAGHERANRKSQANRDGGRENREAVSFMKKLNEVIHRYFPDVLMIAEESTDWPHVTSGREEEGPGCQRGLGYDFKWNMGWMNDTLRYVSSDFSQRSEFHNLLTFSMTYAYSEQFILPLSHDEVVHGKKSLINRLPGDYGQKFAGLRCLYGYWLSHPGKKLLFMGGELAQFIEWNEERPLDWFLLDYEMHRRLQEYVCDLNHLYRKEKAFWQNDQDWSGFAWIDVHNWQQSILVFSRRGSQPQDELVILCNFQPQSYENFRIGVPRPGVYEELLNSDQEKYGGENYLNQGLLRAENKPWHGQKNSLVIHVPSLAIVILKPILNTKVLEE